MSGQLSELDHLIKDAESLKCQLNSGIGRKETSEIEKNLMTALSEVFETAKMFTEAINADQLAKMQALFGGWETNPYKTMKGEGAAGGERSQLYEKLELIKASKFFKRAADLGKETPSALPEAIIDGKAAHFKGNDYKKRKNVIKGSVGIGAQAARVHETIDMMTVDHSHRRPQNGSPPLTRRDSGGDHFPSPRA